MDKGKYKHCLSSSEPAIAVADWTRAGHLTQAHQSGPQDSGTGCRAQSQHSVTQAGEALADCEQISEENEAW